MTTLNEAAGWAHALEELVKHLAPRFRRIEARQRALSYLRGLLAPLERKNGWHLAEAAGAHARRPARLPWARPLGRRGGTR